MRVSGGGHASEWWWACEWWACKQSPAPAHHHHTTQINFEVVATIKERLLMYGASTSGNKAELCGMYAHTCMCDVCVYTCNTCMHV